MLLSGGRLDKSWLSRENEKVTSRCRAEGGAGAARKGDPGRGNSSMRAGKQEPLDTCEKGNEPGRLGWSEQGEEPTGHSRSERQIGRGRICRALAPAAGVLVYSHTWSEAPA